jgi:CTP synthase
VSASRTPSSGRSSSRASPSEHDGGSSTATGTSADLLADAGARSDLTEFYSPVPDGYRHGLPQVRLRRRHGDERAGQGHLRVEPRQDAQGQGAVVAPIKLEGYLNIDSGTLNPYRHGEVFVLDDGTECDMDLGTYERMLDQDLTRRNFVTAGRSTHEILDRERQGVYLGRDVQMIPHVTGEVKRKLRELALRGDGTNPADVVFVEVGGTVGDYENGFYIEALRELAFEEGPERELLRRADVRHRAAGARRAEVKAAQLGIKRLMEAGVQPQVIACRAGAGGPQGA